jgi:hypothetical protein
VLARNGWLRRVGHTRRNRSRGRPETLYRATEMVLFDADLWALLPYSVRLAYSWSLFQAIAKELREGIEGACFNGRRIRELTSTPLELDETGWRQMIAKLASHLDLMTEEQQDAKIRAARTGDALFRVGLLQGGFESLKDHDQLPLDLADGATEPLTPFPERLAPLFEDRLSMEILAQLNRSELSVRQFHRQFRADKPSEGVVRHRFDRLKELAWVSVVDKVPRRGAKEYIYRATKPMVSLDEPWSEVPDVLRKTELWSTFERFSELVKEALSSGTFDMRDDRHLSWTIVDLDRSGWRNAVADMESLEAFGRNEERRSRKRIAAGAKPLTMVLALAAIESPNGFGKAP